MRKRKPPTQDQLKKQMERDRKEIRSICIRQLYMENLERSA